MQAQTILFTGTHQVALDSATIPDPGPGELLIQSAYTCISPGTELRCLAGQQPESAPWPFIPGYALAGTVTACGPNCTVVVGTQVVCAGTQRVDRARQWGGHISHAICHEDAIYVVPPGVDLLEASIAPLAAIAYHGVRLARVALHETLVVAGLGPIGQLSLRLHSLAGVDAVGCDRLAPRVDFARSAGLRAVQVGDDLAAAVRALLPNGADVVVDATGTSAAFADVMAVARDLAWDDAPTPGPRYVIQGSYPDAMAIPYQAAFRKELTFLMPRNYQPRDLRAVLSLLARGKLSLRDMATAVRTPAEAPDTYAQLRERDPGLMTAVFHWQ